MGDEVAHVKGYVWRPIPAHLANERLPTKRRCPPTEDQYERCEHK